jgi:hypothetical protein
MQNDRCLFPFDCDQTEVGVTSDGPHCRQSRKNSVKGAKKKRRWFEEGRNTRRVMCVKGWIAPVNAGVKISDHHQQEALVEGADQPLVHEGIAQAPRTSILFPDRRAGQPAPTESMPFFGPSVQNRGPPKDLLVPMPSTISISR